MVCRRCAKDNPAENRFCSRCGLELTDPEPTKPSDGEQMYCHRHPKEPTNLFCGKCERPICTRCLVMSPAGVRCKECSRHKVSVRPAAVLHEASQPFKALFRMGPMSIWIVLALIGLVGTVVRSCARPAFPPSNDYGREEEPTRTPDRPAEGP